MRGKVISISLIALFALSVFIGCGTKETPLSVDSVFADTDSDIDVSPAPSAASTTLTDAEKEGILYMREEEKLARDVYIALGEKWSLRNFSNIASSEQTHMNAVKTLIDKYGLDDPIEGKNEGEFTNGELQDLYDNLIEQGMKSPEEALKVGAAIEEIDIIDLQNHIAETDKEDIKFVYGNLLKGSKNHLVSFTSVLTRYGVTYQPQYLSEDDYNKIIGEVPERQKGQRKGRR